LREGQQNKEIVQFFVDEQMRILKPDWVTHTGTFSSLEFSAMHKRTQHFHFANNHLTFITNTVRVYISHLMALLDIIRLPNIYLKRSILLTHQTNKYHIINITFLGYPIFSVDIHPDGSRFATGGGGILFLIQLLN
jgi:hypothetical protein